MQGYSVNGYLNAVLRRSGKTLLIEGPSDKTILNRIRLEKHPKQQTGTIDCVEIISDQCLTGQGNRAKIKTIENHFNSINTETIIKTKAKFACLTDREWDNVDISAGIPTEWSPPTQTSNSYATLGHSIENYLFCPDAVSSQLKLLFPNHVHPEYLQEIRTRFRKIIAISAAYSIALHDYGHIKRADGLITKDDIRWTGDFYEIDINFDSRALQRGIAAPGSIRTKINQLANDYIAKHASHIPGKWISHGHLGEQVIWACIANMALEFGTPENQAREIERGSKENRVKCAADHLSRRSPVDREPLDSLLGWLDA